MLRLYRRHTATCHVHSAALTTREKRSFVNCTCPIWIYGRTPQGETVKRSSTKMTDWTAAETFRLRAMDQQHPLGRANGMLIADCVEGFLAGKRDEIDERTEDAYRLLLGRLREHCVRQGIQHIRGLTISMVEDFRNSLQEKASTRHLFAGKIKCFLHECFRLEWIARPLHEQMKRVVVPTEQKEPYEPEEIKLILAEALTLTGGTTIYADNPVTFHTLLRLMLETGLRVSDAIRFNPAEVRKGDEPGVWVYNFVKTKRRKTESAKPMDAYLSDNLKKSIDTCPWLSKERPFMRPGLNMYKQANQVWERMQTLGEKCGVQDCRPHRLRDSFAVNALLGGVSLDDLSRLLGHSSVKLTEVYYARWVPARARRLEGIVSRLLINPVGN